MHDHVLHHHGHETGTALHARIRAAIAALIVSGEWPPGYRIPPEHEIMAEWGCARATVSKALAALAAEGMVIRNRRAGTVVARPRIHTAILNIPDVQSEIVARGLSYDYRCLLDELRQACCVHLGGQGHELGESRFVRSLHLGNAMPLMLEERHIFLEAVQQARTADFKHESPGAWLLAHVPWTEAEHRITATAAESQAARLLDLPSGSPCLTIERRTWREARTVTIVRQVFRGDTFDLTARFAPAVR